METRKESTMKQKIVLFDMDGTLCRYDEKLLRLAHERFGLPLYTSEEVTSFETVDVFPEPYRTQVDAIADEEGFFTDLKPYPGALEAFREIAFDKRIAAFICTTAKRHHKSRSCSSEKYGWVAEFIGREWADRVILTRDKTLVHGDVIIDDKPRITGAMEPSWQHVYHDRPYNRTGDKPRIVSWAEWKKTLLPVLGL